MTDRLPVSGAHLRFVAGPVALAAIWLTMLLGGAGPLDHRIYEALYSGHDPRLLGAARFFTTLGEPTTLIAAGIAVALWLLVAGRARLALVLVAVILAGRGLAEAQKYAIGRVRPAAEPHLVAVKTPSFPSGHAANSMIFYLALALMLIAGTRWRRPAVVGGVLLSLLIGTSRVMLGVHWPSDVIGGWAFGLLWVMLTFRLSERLTARRFGSPP